MSLITSIPSGYGAQLGPTISANVPGLTSVALNSALILPGIVVTDLADVTELTMPNLTNVDPSNIHSGFITIARLASLTVLTAPLLQSVSTNFNINTCASLTVLTFPALMSGVLNFSGNVSLSSVSLSLWTPTNATNVNFSGCALSATSVNHILARCVANDLYASGTVNLSGGTNAAPTGQGLTDKATLAGRGVTVTTN